jgi:hypothetical protein
MIYAFVHGDPGVFAEASYYLTRPCVYIQLDKDDVNTRAKKDEIVKFGFAHRITGLQGTCRQIQLETEHFKPLWKNIGGSSKALTGVFDQPNPFEYVRCIIIYLEVGDIVHDREQVHLSEELLNLLVHLAYFRYLEIVRLHRHESASDQEGELVVNDIWNLLKMDTWVQPHFELKLT